MINQTPPELMSTKDSLDEVASLMMRGVERLKKRSENRSLREYLTGLQRQQKRSCQYKKQRKKQ